MTPTPMARGKLELVFESLGNSLASPRKQIIMPILGKISSFIKKIYVLCTHWNRLDEAISINTINIPL